jgi:hypothetical protein
MACQQPEKIKSLGYYINNGGLEKWEKGVEKGEPVGLPSIFGGTSMG